MGCHYDKKDQMVQIEEGRRKFLGWGAVNMRVNSKVVRGERVRRKWKRVR